MGVKSKEYMFDIGRKKYLEIMHKYGVPNENSIKTDKDKFKEFYRVFGLEFYEDKEEKKKFIIPYEMADLYCLMIVSMKSSPTYDKRKQNYSLLEIINHNKEIVNFIDNLPTPISDYFKATPEYYNTLCFINYMPVVLERMSALLHLALDVTEVPTQAIFDNLIDGLDEAYEQYFWEYARKESVSEYLENNKEAFKSVFENDFDISQSKIFHSLYIVLTDLFRKLDRSNWPKDFDLTVEKRIEKLKKEYKGVENIEERIRNDFLFWLCNQKWHVLNKSIAASLSSIFATDDLIKEKLRKYNEKYNKSSIIHPLFLNNNESIAKDNCSVNGDLIDKMEEEISQISQALQNEIDSYIIHELLLSVGDLEIFTRKFQHPFVAHLSNSIFAFIENLLSTNPLEFSFTQKLLNSESAKNANRFLQAYLHSMDNILSKFDNKYKKYSLLDYVEAVLKGTKDFNNCCSEIYIEVHVKIQSQKCDRFNKKEYSYLHESIAAIAGQELREILLKEYIEKH